MNDGSYAVADDGESQLVPADNQQRDASSVAGSASCPMAGAVGEAASVSARLVTARIALGLEASDVAVRTRVTLRHIEALEAGDYSGMPGRPYAIGFARAYARAVGLPDAEIAEAVRAELEGTAPRPEPRILNQFEVGDPAKTPSRLLGWLAFVLVGGLLAMGGIFWRSYYAPAVPLPALVTDISSPVARPEKRPEPRVSDGPVVFTALEEGIWVKFYDGGGKQLMQKQLAKGETYTVPQDVAGARLWTGRPDALSIMIGGKPVPPLADTERVMKDIPVDSASLRARPRPVPSAAPAPAGG
ncbi:MAG: hypothetical protein RIQ75_1633 [Pseudomonadota bacterium]